MVEQSNKPLPEIIDTLTPSELIQRNIEHERLEHIHLDRVLTEHALIDPTHADELKDSMNQKRGQITPIAVRARLDDEGEVVYDVIDGFHRTEGKKRSGDTTIKANVLYNCSDEEMTDLRILAASSVKSVQFARLVQWISNSFDNTPWADRGLSVSQAFGLAMNKSSKSRNSDLTTEEIKELEEWAKIKCNRWNKTLPSVYQDLRLAANANPALVQEVRTASGGSSRETTITRQKLAKVVNAFPGDEYHSLQEQIIRYVIDNRMKIDQIEALINTLQDKPLFEMSPENIAVIIEKAHTSLSTVQNTETTIFEEDDESEMDETLENEPTIAELRAIENGSDDVGTKRKTNPSKKTRSNGFFPIHEASSKSPSLSFDGESDTAKKRIGDLEQALAKANEQLQSPQNAWRWWETAEYLTEEERVCVDSVLIQGKNPGAIGYLLGLTERQVFARITSALSRRKNYLEDQKIYAS